MANAFTGGASGAAWDLLVETAFDRKVEYYLRDEPQWSQLIDKHPEQQAMPGDVVTLTLHNPFAALATSPLTETVDPDAVAAPAPTRVQVAIQEWGNASLQTLRLRETGFTSPSDELAELIGRNMYDSIDSIIKSVADAGTNILWNNGGVLQTANTTTPGTDVQVTTSDTLTRKPAVAAVKLLQRAKVMPKQGGKYVAVMHPDVAFDLQAENSATAWNSPHTYGGDTAAIYSGAVGDYQGARYIETTRTTITATGAGAIPVYSTYYFGRQALVSVEVQAPHVVVGPQIDKLKRFYPLGWYALGGWSIYRPQSLVTVRTTSSISSL